VGFAPTGKRRLFTAHTQLRHWPRFTSLCPKPFPALSNDLVFRTIPLLRWVGHKALVYRLARQLFAVPGADLYDLSAERDFQVKTKFQSKWILIFYNTVGAIGFLIAFFLIHLPHGPEHWSSDLQTAWLSDKLDSQHSRVVVIEITDQTLADQPYTSPPDRQLIADLIYAADIAGAAAIGIDITFDHATEPRKDLNLIERIKATRAHIVLGFIDDWMLPTENARKFQTNFIAEVHRPLGHLYFNSHLSPLSIGDDVVRFMTQNFDSPVQVSLAEMMARVAGVGSVPASSRISWLLTPKDNTETFLTLPAEHVLGRGGLPALPLNEMLGGKLVLIGGNLVSRDQHLTPLSIRSKNRFPGVFIHAQVLAQYVDKRWIFDPGWPFDIVLSFIALAGGNMVGRSRRAEYNHPWLEIVSVICLIFITIISFWLGRFVFPFVSVSLAWGAGITGGHFGRQVLRRDLR
jgi:CHASE2 domain-containing sensor protein